MFESVDNVWLRPWWVLDGEDEPPLPMLQTTMAVTMPQVRFQPPKAMTDDPRRMD